MNTFQEFYNKRIDEVHNNALEKLGLGNVLEKLKDKNEMMPNDLKLQDYATIFKINTVGVKELDLIDFKNAYRKLAKEYHPDRGGDEEIMAMYNDMISKFDIFAKDLVAKQKAKKQAQQQAPTSSGFNSSGNVYRYDTKPSEGGGLMRGVYRTGTSTSSNKPRPLNKY